MCLSKGGRGRDENIRGLLGIGGRKIEGEGKGGERGLV